MIRDNPRNYQQLKTLSIKALTLNKTPAMWIKETQPDFSFLFSTIHKHAMPGL